MVGGQLKIHSGISSEQRSLAERKDQRQNRQEVRERERGEKTGTECETAEVVSDPEEPGLTDQRVDGAAEREPF